MERVVAPLNGAWSDPADTERRLVAFERALGTTLPAVYRAFLIRFDGGRPYPNTFQPTLACAGSVLSSTECYVDAFYSLAEVEAYTRGEVYGQGQPPGMLSIGGDSGGLELLLSLRPQDIGTIHMWMGSTFLWGTDGNDEGALHFQAPDFPAFVSGLTDPDGSGHGHWATPRNLLLAKSLSLG
jgi:SMI1 / KNR4 family (SUKH-1)